MLEREAFQIPLVPLGLTLAGVLPFVALAVAMLTTDDVIVRAQAALWLVVYAAVILSFLGGVRWGLAMARGQAQPIVFVLSVVGSLAGWALVILGFSKGITAGLLLAAAGLFILHWVWDVLFAEAAPAWFSGVRTLGTLGATLSLIAASLG